MGVFQGLSAAVKGAPSVPADVSECERTVRFFMLEKAFYEIAYELANRPDWVEVPLRGALTPIAGASPLLDGVPPDEAWRQHNLGPIAIHRSIDKKDLKHHV
jgi:hypothetical protein